MTVFFISLLAAWIFESHIFVEDVQAETNIHNPEVMAITSLVLSLVIGTFVVAGLSDDKEEAIEQMSKYQGGLPIGTSSRKSRKFQYSQNEVLSQTDFSFVGPTFTQSVSQTQFVKHQTQFVKHQTQFVKH